MESLLRLRMRRWIRTRAVKVQNATNAELTTTTIQTLMKEMSTKFGRPLANPHRGYLKERVYAALKTRPLSFQKDTVNGRVGS